MVQTNMSTAFEETTHICPNCGIGKMHIFYSKSNAPSHSVVLLPTYEEAIDYPCGDIQLGFCKHCGFVSNLAYDESIQDYSKDYEATQSYSPTFNKFAERVANRLIEKYDLHDKQIIEIGCGQGEFLTMLCEYGHNTGVGFDPAYRNEEIDSEAKDRMTFIADYYGEKYTDQDADFVACKMTLEHIPDTLEFIKTVRKAMGDRFDSVIFFQIPNAEHVFKTVAFWDVYFEHCSYFSFTSLAYLFRAAGFDVLDVSADYDDQYLMIEAKPSRNPESEPETKPDEVEKVAQEVEKFQHDVELIRQKWSKRLAEMDKKGQKVVIWGSGSKAVAFLTTLGIKDQIEYVVDINPRKNDTFMAGTGQRIVIPEFLVDNKPDVVIIMNPIYIEEISASLEKMGVQAEVLTIED